MALGEEWLNSLEGKWTAEASKQNDGLPDGKYGGSLTLVQLKEFSSGAVGVQWEYVVAEGEHAGVKHMDFDTLTEKDGSTLKDGAFTKLGQKMRKFGIDPAGFRPAELPQIFSDLTDRRPYVRWTVKTRSGTGQWEGQTFKNMYIDKVTDESPDGDGGSAEYFTPNIGDKLKVKTASGVITAELVSIDDDEDTIQVKNAEGEIIEISTGNIIGPA